MISDVFEFVDELKNILTTNGDLDDKNIVSRALSLVFNDKGRSASLQKKAKDAIMQFPILISDAVNKNTLTLMNKALEVEYSHMVRLAVSLENVVDLSTPNAKRAFIQRLHQNIEIEPENSNLAKMVHNTESFEILNKELLIPFEEDLKMESVNSLTIKNFKLLEAVPKKPIVDSSKEKIDSKMDQSDLRKANELAPTIFELNVEYKNGDTLKTVQLLIGIKCVSHLIPSEEMLYFLGRSVKEDSLIFRLIQWTTGEISFFKDFVLTLDRVKSEAQAGKSFSSKWWRKLKNLSLSSRFKTFLGSTKLIPNATIIISMEEVQRLKNTQAIDLENPDIVEKIFNIFFLLGFVIVDDIDEMCYIFEEDTRTFQIFSYNALKKETKEDSSDLKALISLIGR